MAKCYQRVPHTGSLFVLAKEGNPDMSQSVSPNLHTNRQAFFDDEEYPEI